MPKDSRLLGVTPNGKYAITNHRHSGKSSLIVYSLSTSQIARRYEVGRLGQIVDFAFSGSDYAASATKTGQVKLWNIESGKSFTPIINEFNLQCLSFAPSATFLAVGSGQGIGIFNLVAEDRPRLLISSCTISCLAFNSASTLLLSGSADQNVRLWTLSTGKFKPLKYTAPVAALCFSAPRSSDAASREGVGDAEWIYTLKTGQNSIKVFSTETREVVKEVQMRRKCHTSQKVCMNGVFAAHLMAAETGRGAEVEIINLRTGASVVGSLGEGVGDSEPILLGFAKVKPSVGLGMAVEKHLTSLLKEAQERVQDQAKEIAALKHAVVAAAAEPEVFEDAGLASASQKHIIVDGVYIPLPAHNPSGNTIAADSVKQLGEHNDTLMSLSESVRNLQAKLMTSEKERDSLQRKARSLEMTVAQLQESLKQKEERIFELMCGMATLPVKGDEGRTLVEAELNAPISPTGATIASNAEATTPSKPYDQHASAINNIQSVERRKERLPRSPLRQRQPLHEPRRSPSRTHPNPLPNARFPNESVHSLFSSASKEFIVTVPKPHRPTDVENLQVKWLHMERSPTTSGRPQETIKSASKRSPTSPLKQPGNFAHAHHISPKQPTTASKHATPPKENTDYSKRVEQLEKERDNLEEELLMRYTEMRNMQKQFEEELAQRDRELETLGGVFGLTCSGGRSGINI
ncbi:hypothetical protein HDV05_003349 [Chytridiales sp. JEL 0842]|nr:hypothetical protein HDV05_003349 [Chytridiales sp. JEL 0842]